MSQSTSIASAIQDKNAAFGVNFKANDFVKVAANYTGNGMLLPPNGKTISGREAVVDFWTWAASSLGIADVTLTLDEIEHGGDVVAERGSFDLRTANGDLLDRGSYVVLWKREDGDWKMHWDIWNSDRPAG